MLELPQVYLTAGFNQIPEPGQIKLASLSFACVYYGCQSLNIEVACMKIHHTFSMI